MTTQFAFAAPMIAVAATLSVSVVLAPSSSAAETCLAAPKSPSPEGSRWRYRIDRATQRKCWHLVKLDQQPQRTAKGAAPQPEPMQKEDAAPEVEAPAEGVQPATQHGWLTRSASAVPEAVAPTQAPLEATAERAEVQSTPSVSVAHETIAQKQSTEATAPIAPPPAAEPQQTNIAPQVSAAVSASPGNAQFAFAAIAGVALLAAAIFFLVSVRRRNTDVLTRIAREDTISAELPEVDAPTFSPIPPIRLTPQHDDVDQALQRRARRRMAA
jgi:hypothetical protein